MTKHRVLNGISYPSKDGQIRLGPGDELDSSAVKAKDLTHWLAEGDIGKAAKQKTKPKGGD